MSLALRLELTAMVALAALEVALAAAEVALADVDDDDALATIAAKPGDMGKNNGKTIRAVLNGELGTPKDHASGSDHTPKSLP